MAKTAEQRERLRELLRPLDEVEAAALRLVTPAQIRAAINKVKAPARRRYRWAMGVVYG